MGQTVSTTYTTKTHYDNISDPTALQNLLQDHEQIIRLNPLVTALERSADDSYPGPYPHPHPHQAGDASTQQLPPTKTEMTPTGMTGYIVHDRVPLLPSLGLYKHISYRAWLHQPAAAAAAAAAADTDETNTGNSNGLVSHIEAPLGLVIDTEWRLMPGYVEEIVQMRGRSGIVAFSAEASRRSHEELVEKMVVACGGRVVAGPGGEGAEGEERPA